VRAATGLTFGLVGLGYWGPNLLRVLAEVPGAEVKWICDLDAQRLSDISRRYPSCTRTSDIDHLFEDDELDAILIATPVVTHFDLAARSLQAGKHTFVEKPLAQSGEQANQLLELAETQDLVLMCGHTYLYSPSVRAVKKLLDQGELGEILFVSSSRVFGSYPRADHNVIWDLAPHDFSILLHWLEEMPRSVRAVGRDSMVQPGIADVAFVTMTYASGIIANIELSWLAPSKLRRTVIVGSKKIVVYDDGTPEPVRVFDHLLVHPEASGDRHLSYRIGEIRSPPVETYEPITKELEDFARVISERPENVASAALARNVVLVTESADKSLQLGGAEVLVEPPQRGPAVAGMAARVAAR
jgi:predicted dehydrogenase